MASELRWECSANKYAAGRVVYKVNMHACDWIDDFTVPAFLRLALRPPAHAFFPHSILAIHSSSGSSSGSGHTFPWPGCWQCCCSSQRARITVGISFLRNVASRPYYNSACTSLLSSFSWTWTSRPGTSPQCRRPSAAAPVPPPQCVRTGGSINDGQHMYIFFLTSGQLGPCVASCVCSHILRSEP